MVACLEFSGCWPTPPAWSSFRSHCYPDRYIRHYDYVLRIDPISTAVGRADVTFSTW
ncbi:AbfB domain-containing protein [Streptomyces sp. HD]|uniref:AbfB domain-containing protein n=1 Tax=Streptomyces sp. HD TaxID=3020892 RepID=UPI003FA6EB89